MTMPIESQSEAGACLPGGSTISPRHAEQVALVAKALSDPVRLRIFHHIAASRCSSVCACNLSEVFGVTQPTLSHHLKKLVEAGLVNREMRGRWAHFTLRLRGFSPSRTSWEASGDKCRSPSAVFVHVKSVGRSWTAPAPLRHPSDRWKVMKPTAPGSRDQHSPLRAPERQQGPNRDHREWRGFGPCGCGA